MIPSDAIEWTCRCGAVNSVDRGRCPKCKELMPTAAKLFRTNRVLTPEEQNYYTMQIPIIIGELRALNAALRKQQKGD